MTNRLRLSFILFFILFSLLTLTVGCLIRYSAFKSIVLPIVLNYNIQIEKNLAERLDQLLNDKLWYTKDQIAQEHLNKHLEMILSQSDIISLSIYNKNLKRVYKSSSFEIDDETNILDNFILRQKNRQDEIENIQQGKIFTRLLVKATLYDNEKQQNATVYETIIPITRLNNDLTTIDNIGYVEIHSDLSLQWLYVKNLQVIVVGILLLIIGAVLILLERYLSSSSEIISEQDKILSELKSRAEQAESENQEKSKFLANVSHELRTPLNAIIGFSEIMKNEAMGKIGVEIYKEYANDIYNSGNHLLSLINDILDYSKAMADKLVVEKVEVDVNKTIKTCLKLVLPRAQDAGVELVEQLPEQHIILIADPKRLKQIVLNLLSNAVKFTPEGSTVQTSAMLFDDKIVIEIKDHGIGIGARDIAKAMSSFGQVDSKLSKRYEGTGLGLPLTKKLVEIMGGKFEITSELGFGTTVTISFPIIPIPTLK